MDVIVVGAGIVGASVAYRLSAEGLGVTLIDAGRLGGGTSAATFAWINANSKGPFAYHFLNVCGMAEHLTLCRELGQDGWLSQSGNLEWAGTPKGTAALDDKVARLRGWGYPVETLSRRDVAALEPGLVLPRGVERAAYFPTEGYVDVPSLVGALAEGARARGAAIRTTEAVVELLRDGDRVTGVRTGKGERLTADWVVSCAGHRTPQLAALAGVQVPMRGEPGISAYSAPSPAALRSILHAPDLSVRPDGAGRLMIRAAEFDRGVTEATPLWPLPPACEVLRERTAALLPAFTGTPIESVRVGVRPMPEDGYPLVGPVPGRRGLYLVCSHSAVTLGPLLGRIVAREIAGGQVDARIAEYRAGRTMGAAAAG